MEIASEFLEMAARLIYIKTVSLLPKYDEADDLKQELTGELIEYAVCKKIAERLRNDFIGYDIFVREQMHIVIDGKYKRIHSSNELIDAFLAAAGRKRRNMPLEAEIFHPIVSREFVSVTSKIIYVLRHMYKSGSITMDKLFDGLENRSECVATFLAILELSKTGRIYISDDNKRIDFCGRSKQQRHNEVVT
ncbi:MAG: segregation/condensation protein A, partial [Clostridiales bacterium]|nr:segregation/condensation protein A [Clostridiales bacterium]